VTDQPAWTLLEFVPKLDEWIAIEHPLPELRVLLTDWIFTRVSDPFANARRVVGFADYWLAVVPGSDHFDDYAERSGVICLLLARRDGPDRQVRPLHHAVAPRRIAVPFARCGAFVIPDIAVGVRAAAVV